MDWAFDALIAVSIVLLGWQTLFTRDLFKSVFFFIVFGLLMALAWVRLHAPDVALAEAAIGAGLSGVLLLDAARRFQRPYRAAKAARQHQESGRFTVRWVSAVGALLLAALLVGAIWGIPHHSAGLTGMVDANMAQSGVEHPVTAVLLNFRAYDTWLEIGVLLMAVLGMLLFQRRSDLRAIRPLPAPDPVLYWLVRLLFPVLVLVAGYLLWIGKYNAGGAFQAGVVLGAGGVLLWLSGHPSLTGFTGWHLRLLLVLGFGVFQGTAVVTALMQQALFQFPVAHAGSFILLLEGAATLSIGTIVATLILALQPVRGEERA